MGQESISIPQPGTAWRLVYIEDPILHSVGFYYMNAGDPPTYVSLSHDELTAQLLKFIHENQGMKDLLAEIQWAGNTLGQDECPVCHRTQNEGHAPDCKLNQFLTTKGVP